MENKKIITISEANQNFSKVARLCKENEEIYILKNNKLCFILKNVEKNVDVMELNDTKKIENLYDECKEIMTPSFETRFHSSMLSNAEIKRFFICVADFFLQMRQKEAINNKRY